MPVVVFNEKRSFIPRKIEDLREIAQQLNETDKARVVGVFMDELLKHGSLNKVSIGTLKVLKELSEEFASATFVAEGTKYEKQGS